MVDGCFQDKLFLNVVNGPDSVFMLEERTLFTYGTHLSASFRGTDKGDVLLHDGICFSRTEEKSHVVCGKK